jgi:tRNA threonylcarbamoyladenosine biosynthesis protein TsaB
MIKILSIETSTQVCSVALHVDGKLLAINELRIGQAHATKLAVLIEQISLSTDISIEQLDAVAISAGPGSYTGLRIGTSTAKGICLAANIPLIAVPTLEAMALHAQPYNVLKASVCPMIDARRMEVYCRLSNHQGNEILGTHAKIIDEQSFNDELNNGPILFYGDGASKCKSVITHKNAMFIDNLQASANEVGVLAYRKFQNGSIESLLEFEPIYLKEFLIKPSTKS